MDTNEIYERLDKIFRKLFDDDTITVTADTTAKDIDGWDSLEHITLIDTVQRTFGMKFKMSEISSMKDVGQMVEIIQERATK
ncbi:MAG: acyl carrier protein [Oscillospiraceae bacterium]|nr:acyl carrier protein [Oscillospiraceae bacterium]